MLFGLLGHENGDRYLGQAIQLLLKVFGPPTGQLASADLRLLYDRLRPMGSTRMVPDRQRANEGGIDRRA
jgi:hypothetical protein